MSTIEKLQTIIDTIKYLEPSAQQQIFDSLCITSANDEHDLLNMDLEYECILDNSNNAYLHEDEITEDNGYYTQSAVDDLLNDKDKEIEDILSTIQDVYEAEGFEVLPIDVQKDIRRLVHA